MYSVRCLHNEPDPRERVDGGEINGVLELFQPTFKFNANGRDIVVIGRLTKFSCAAFLACTLIGSTSCCVDAKLNSKFYSLDFSYKTIIIDAAYLKDVCQDAF